jgi:hypothetical protein
MRKPIAWAVVLVLVAALSVGVSQGLGASAPVSVPTPVEPAVPAPGAVVTSSQIETVRQTALNVAAESGEMAPAVTMAGETMSLAGAVPAISEQSATAPEITDPRTDRPFSQSSVFVVTMTGNSPRLGICTQTARHLREPI